MFKAVMVLAVAMFGMADDPCGGKPKPKGGGGKYSNMSGSQRRNSKITNRDPWSW